MLKVLHGFFLLQIVKYERNKERKKVVKNYRIQMKQDLMIFNILNSYRQQICLGDSWNFSIKESLGVWQYDFFPKL